MSNPHEIERRVRDSYQTATGSPPLTPHEKEKIARESYNSQHSYQCKKETLPIGDQGAKHEFDLYEEGKVIGGISTSSWKTSKKNNNNTGGQDRVSTELLWLTLWPGNEKRVLILTDHDMSKNIHTKFRGTPFAKKVYIFHFDLNNKSFKKTGELG